MKRLHFLVFAALCLIGCSNPSGPSEQPLEASYVVSRYDSVTTQVLFQATGPGKLYYRLDWVSADILFDYGSGVQHVGTTIYYPDGLKFWMDFTVWNSTDTVVVSYFNP